MHGGDFVRGANFDAAGRFDDFGPGFVEEGEARKSAHGRDRREKRGGGIFELGEGSVRAANAKLGRETCQSHRRILEDALQDRGGDEGRLVSSSLQMLVSDLWKQDEIVRTKNKATSG